MGTTSADREKLTAEQRDQYNRFCALLKENGVLTDENALKAAQVIATEDGIYKKHALQQLAVHADQQAVVERQKALGEADRQAEYIALKAEQQRVAQEQDAARWAARESEQLARAEADREAQRIAAHEAARREPTPGSIDQFNSALARAQTERHEASIARFAETRGDRPNSNRFEKLKAEQAQAEVKYDGLMSSYVSDKTKAALSAAKGNPRDGKNFGRDE